MRHIGNVLLIGAIILGACDDDSSSGDDGTGGTAESNSEVCYTVDVNTTADGTQSCGPEVCQAGDYCASDVGICDPGCLSELDCASGEYCDLSNPSDSLDDEPVGVCREPGSDLETPCPTDSVGDDCQTRCEDKGDECGAPAGEAATICEGICESLDDDELDCLEATACEDFEAAAEGSLEMLCGIDLSEEQ